MAIGSPLLPLPSGARVDAAEPRALGPRAMTGIHLIRVGSILLGCLVLAILFTLAAFLGSPSFSEIPSVGGLLCLEVLLAIACIFAILVSALRLRGQALEALRLSEARLESAQIQAGFGMWELEESSGRRFWSTQMYKIFGIPPGPPPSFADFLELVHPHDREALVALNNQVLRTGVPGTITFRSASWGSVGKFYQATVHRTSDASGRVLGLAGTILDVTAHRLAEEALRKSESRYRLLAENACDLISRHDRTGIYIYASPASATVLGHSPSELLGKTFCDFISPDDRPRAHQVMSRLGDGVSPQSLILRSTRPNGDAIWLETRARIVRGGTLGEEILCITRDITEQKRLEEQFRQSQKMEAIGRLAGGVAHDFNNMLTVINGTTDLLLQGLPGEDPARPLLVEVAKAGSRATELTRQLLAFSRRQLLALRVVHWNSIITGMGKMLSRLLGEDVSLSTQLAADLGYIRGDIGQLEQVLLNLAVNARDAMPEGGCLQISTTNIELGPALEGHHFHVHPGAYVLLTVTDNGCGMSEEIRNRIFEPFFTTKESGKGTGLGLATVYGIVKQCEGYITVDSAPEKGTSFQIYLPRMEEAPKGVTEVAPTLSPSRGSETVLLVEDDEAVRALAGHILCHRGYRVVSASDGVEALQVWDNHETPIDVLVTDVVMPHMNGRELADRLRAFNPDLKILYMSGYTDDAILRHGVLGQGIAFLHKPFRPDDLAYRVRNVLDGDFKK